MHERKAQKQELGNGADLPETDNLSESYFLGSEFGVFFDCNATVFSATLDCRAECRLVEVNGDRIFLRPVNDIGSVCAPRGARFFLVFNQRIFDCRQLAMHDGLLVARWSRIYLAGGASGSGDIIPTGFREPPGYGHRSH
jgi:hypothetical protein